MSRLRDCVPVFVLGLCAVVVCRGFVRRLCTGVVCGVCVRGLCAGVVCWGCLRGLCAGLFSQWNAWHACVGDQPGLPR